MSHRTRYLVVAGLLAAAVGLAPLLPEAGTPSGGHGIRYDGALTPVSEPAAPALAASPGRGEVTATMRREIAQVVAAGRSLGPDSGRVTTASLVDTQVRCAVFSGQRYCLGVGWTDDSEAEVRERVAVAATVVGRRTTSATTGDLDLLTTLRTRAARPEGERVEVETAELTEAAASVAKVWLLRHEVQGVPLPGGFLDDHPEAIASDADAQAAATPKKPRKKGRLYPRKAKIMKSARTKAQNRSWWCGPSAIQTIAWGWQHEKRPQSHWARKLGTTTDGSAISEIVRLVNRKTGYDSPRRAGPYVVLDISGLSYREWFRMAKRHIARLRAPLVLHPQLLQRYYPYLSFDASGHFQVGRGYKDKRNGVERIGFFEPWNQQAFDPGSPYVDRVQWRSAYRSFRANKAHPMQNIGL